MLVNIDKLSVVVRNLVQIFLAIVQNGLTVVCVVVFIILLYHFQKVTQLINKCQLSGLHNLKFLSFFTFCVFVLVYG